MNLHEIAVGVTAAVNPMMRVCIHKSSGYTTAADGTQMPFYTPIFAWVDIQALHAHELKHLEELNIQGVIRKLYARGSVNSIIRDAYEGGDMISWYGREWKVVHVFETWQDWCAVAIKQQASQL